MLRPTLLAGALLSVAAPLAAQSDAARMSGTWQFDSSRSDNVQQAISATVRRINVLLRGFANARLRRTNQPYQRVVLAFADDAVTIRTDSRPPLTLPLNGTPVDWTRPEDRERLKVSARWEGDKLVQTFRAEDGQRVNAWSVTPDGQTLVLEVTVSSPRLPEPLRYTLRYRRVSE